MTTLFHAIAASICIGLGVYVLLTVGGVVGSILFSLGLTAVCVLDLELFTGRCGFMVANRIPIRKLLLVLAVNLLAGYLLGATFALTNELLATRADLRVGTWSVSLGYFLKSLFCGIIMYIAVALYKRGTYWGILLGVPLFILCGFQHCIANVITLGISHQMNIETLGALGLCVFGNFAGSILMWAISPKKTMLQ